MLFWFGHGCAVSVGCWNTKVVKYGLGMDALESGCSWNTTVIVVWAKMHW